MNIYRFKFVSRCPNNNKPIMYEFELRKPDADKVFVEHIEIAAALYDTAFHEQIADAFFKQFGGQQILKAHHHGIDIETHRGFDAPDCGRLVQRVQVGSAVYEKGTEAKLAIEAISR